MPLYTSVQGGTGAGRKKAPKAQNKTDWECPECHARCKYYWINCPNCSARRPA